MVDPTTGSLAEAHRETLNERNISPSPTPIEETAWGTLGQYLIELLEHHRSELGDKHIEERNRGILSPEDREYLWDQTDYKYEQSKYQARERIRNRVENAILDFFDLEFMLSEDDRSRIFDEFPSNLQDHLILAHRFFYRGLNYDADIFEDIIEQSVYEAENHRYRQQNKSGHVSVDVSIHIDRTSEPEELLERLDRGEPLTDREIGTLVRTGNLSTEQLDGLVEKSQEESVERTLLSRYRRTDKSTN